MATRRGLPAPLTPEQLAALRPKTQVNQQAQASAKQIAYETGISALEAVVTRIEKLEQRVQKLEAEPKLKEKI